MYIYHVNIYMHTHTYPFVRPAGSTLWSNDILNSPQIKPYINVYTFCLSQTQIYLYTPIYIHIHTLL
jgi:hypothetical protein